MSNILDVGCVLYPALNVAVDISLWNRVVDGDEAAVEELRSKVDGLVLYDHLLLGIDGMEFIGIDKLYEEGIIKSITLHSEIV